MLLSDEELYEALSDGYLVIEPSPIHTAIQPSSIDLRLHADLLPQRSDPIEGVFIDPTTIDVMDHITNYGDSAVATEASPYYFKPRTLVIGKTLEFVGLPNQLAARVDGKSSLARLGLLVHLTAPKIDPGFQGQITLEMYNLGPHTIILKEGMDICSLIIERLGKPARQGYSGRFQT
ncbi:MAG: dCTP deaminase [Chloroflexi bacterium]|nr:dCTP deaminase [Chloroflexota bacterium]